MAFLLNLLDQLKDFTIERNKAIHDSQSVPDFIRLAWREDNTYGRLGGAFHHVLALFIETGGDGVLLFEGDKQGRQWRLVVVAKFEVLTRLLEWKPRQALNAPQSLEPRTEFAIAKPAQQIAVACFPIRTFALLRLPNTLRQRLLHFGKLILPLVLCVVLRGTIAHSLLVHQRIVVVVDPHHAIERKSQRPIERRTQPLRFRLQRIDCRSDLEIARSATLDGYNQLPTFKFGIAASAAELIAYFNVIFDVALQQIAAVSTDAVHQGVLSKGKCVATRFLPGLRCPKPLAHQGGAEFIDQFCIDLMAILGANIGERRQCLAKGWCESCYPSGGSSSGGVGSR